MVFVCQTVSLCSWDLSILGGLCLSDGITLLLGLEYVEWSFFVRRIALLLGFEHVGWSLFVRRYSSTPRT